MQAKYKKVLLKISGEALSGSKGFGYDDEFARGVCCQIAKLKEMGVQVAVVIGGGNFWRGRQSKNMDRCTADYMGMLATAMNSIYLEDMLRQIGVKAKVQTSLQIESIAQPFSKQQALEYLEEGNVVIFGCGTGSPFFSTDTAASLRACEIEADAILLAKNIDGIYDSDPKINKNAVKFDKISYEEYIRLGLKAMDITSITMCMEEKMPVFVFKLDNSDSIIKAVTGDVSIGTVVE